MTSTQVESSETIPRTQSRWAGYVPSLFYQPIELLGGITELGSRVVASGVKRPTGYWRAVIDEMYSVLKVGWFPIIASITTFGLMVGIHCINFAKIPGAPARCGEYFFIINIREFTPWINSLVIAGVIGAAICADLGARKVREELDALEVLGVYPVRELVLPRIVSVTLLTPMFMIISVMVIMVDALISSASYGYVLPADYFSLVFDNLTVTELVAAILKAVISGFLIGIISAYKGLTASGGAIGVGRAVNQAVVIAFIGVYVFSGVFNMILQGLFPILQTTR
jgi:phospholipid/cholesterol/gamma-HCH transport system permease protein